jgi:hypothetical protein
VLINEKLRGPILWEFMGNEKEFEEMVVEHIFELCAMLNLPAPVSLQRQKQLRLSTFQCILDILVKHEDDSVTIFEVKKANNKHPHTGTHNQMQGIGQLLLYQNTYETLFDKKPRLILIDNKIYERTVSAFIGNNLPITLVDFQKDRVFIPYKAW